MDNAQKAIMIGVGLFITIIVIAAVMLITGMGQDLLTSGQQEVSNISASLQAQLTSDFDGTTLSGGEVIAAVKRFYTSETMVIRVKATSGTGATIAEYGKVKATGISGDTAKGYAATGTESNTPVKVGKLSDTSSTNSAYYVPNSAKYSANVIKIDGSDTVIGIFFERK